MSTHPASKLSQEHEEPEAPVAPPPEPARD